MAHGQSLPNPSQATQILRWLQAGKKLTPQDALREFGCFRLAARVADLRRDGYKINSDRKKVINSDGTQAVVAEYWISEGDRP
jgi:hypothetical protein